MHSLTCEVCTHRRLNLDTFIKKCHDLLEFVDGGPYHTETSLLICFANQ